jgi:hypothetical protein
MLGRPRRLSPQCVGKINTVCSGTQFLVRAEIVNQVIFVYLFALIAGSICTIYLDYWLAIPIALLFSTFYLIPAFQCLNRQWPHLEILALSKIENFEDVRRCSGQVPDSPIWLYISYGAQSLYECADWWNKIQYLLVLLPLLSMIRRWKVRYRCLPCSV